MHSSVSLSMLVRVPSTVLTSVNGQHVNLEKEGGEDSWYKIFLVVCLKACVILVFQLLLTPHL